MFNFRDIKSQRFSFLFKSLSKINIKLFITFFCLVFLGNSIYVNFDDLANQTVTLKVFIWLFAGIIFSSLSIIINAYAWKLLINNIGGDSNKLNIIKIFLNTNIYKYFPGGIWHFISRYNILRQKFSTEKTVESILLEPLLMLVAGVIFIPFGSLNIYIFILCWSSTLFLLSGFRKFIIKNLKVFKSAIFTYNSKLNDSSLLQDKENISINKTYPYKPLFVEIIFILFRFYGFFCCIKAFSIGLSISQLQLISSFSLAWIIGLIIPAAPGGLGVFESVILFRLGSQLPEAPLLATLLCYRLVSTFSDILAALIYPAKRLFKV